MANRITSVSLENFLMKTNGLLTQPLVIKSATPIRSESKDMSSFSGSKAKIGDLTSPLYLNSKVSPVVNIAGTSFKLYGENNPPNVNSPPGLIAVKIFTASTTYTRPNGVTKLIVEIVGGGGGGAGAVVTAAAGIAAGAGGGSGAYARLFIDATVAKAYQVAPSYAGAGGAGSGVATAGNPGGFSIFGGFITVGSGSGGTSLPLTTKPDYATAMGGKGGTITFGTIPAECTVILSMPGADGDPCIINGNNAWGGKGGDSMLGTGGPSSTSAGNASGANYGYGGGGGGGAMSTGIGGSVGGDGRQGCIIIWEYA